jgi:hypothetical protein
MQYHRMHVQEAFRQLQTSDMAEPLQAHPMCKMEETVEKVQSRRLGRDSTSAHCLDYLLELVVEAVVPSL